MPKDEPKKKEEKTAEFRLGGTLDILGLKIDLGDLLSPQGDVMGSLEELRKKLKAAGGKETLSDEEWRQGISVTGRIRTSSPFGEQEFHVGTMGKTRPPAAQPTKTGDVEEPPVDVFYEEGKITIVADVPGVSKEDLEVKLDGRKLSVFTRPGVRRQYRKTIDLEADVDPASVSTSCRNGVLEVLLKKKAVSP